MRPSDVEEAFAKQCIGAEGIILSEMQMANWNGLFKIVGPCGSTISCLYNGLFLQLQSRGVWPEGCGQVTFSCPVVRKMKPLLMMEEGKVRRVRGIAYPQSLSKPFPG